MTAGNDAGIAGLIRVFYEELWNRCNDRAVDELLAEEFTFRGSLGDRVRGRSGFRAYRDRVRGAFDDFHNEIVELVVDDDRAAARLRYTGRHVGEVLGVPATGRSISYQGAAFFRAAGERIAEVWVLGDLEGLRGQLRAPAHADARRVGEIG